MSVVARLRGCGIPASQWPDLPPEALTAKEQHEVAIQTHEGLLLLPAHQSLAPYQVDVIGRRLQVALLAGNIVPQIKVVGPSPRVRRTTAWLDTRAKFVCCV
jgi:hypothetical protein